MKVKQLLDLLEIIGPEALDKDLILASDAEGNSFSLWDGSFSVANGDTDSLYILSDEDGDDEPVTGIVLWPV